METEKEQPNIREQEQQDSRSDKRGLTFREIIRARVIIDDLNVRKNPNKEALIAEWDRIFFKGHTKTFRI